MSVFILPTSPLVFFRLFSLFYLVKWRGAGEKVWVGKKVLGHGCGRGKLPILALERKQLSAAGKVGQDIEVKATPYIFTDPCSCPVLYLLLLYFLLNLSYPSYPKP